MLQSWRISTGSRDFGGVEGLELPERIATALTARSGQSSPWSSTNYRHGSTTWDWWTKCSSAVAYVKSTRWLRLGVCSEYMSPEDVPGMKTRSKGGACHTIGLHIASNRVSPTRALHDPQARRSSKLHAAYTSLPMPKTTGALAPTFTRPQRRSLLNL